MNKLDQTAKLYTESGQFSRVDWAVKQSGQLSLSGSTCSPLSSAESLVDEPIYRIYSMTKPMVCVAALILVQQQRLNLSDSLKKYLVEAGQQKVLGPDGSLQETKNDITIEHLFMHTAGFSYDFQSDCPIATRYREAEFAEDGSRTLDQLCQELCSIPLSSQPGEKWIYSYSIDILAHVIEIVSGQTIDHFLAEHLTLPLMMTDTSFTVSSKNLPRLLPMYGSKTLGEVYQPQEAQQILKRMDVSRSYPESSNKEFRRGGIGLFSTLQDYLKFCEFLHTGQTESGEQILSPHIHELMWTNRLPQHLRPFNTGTTVWHGYGWNLLGRVMIDVEKAAFKSAPGEGGWAGAASTWFWVDQKNELSGVVMTQFLGSVVPLGPEMQQAAYTDLGLAQETNE